MNPLQSYSEPKAPQRSVLKNRAEHEAENGNNTYQTFVPGRCTEDLPFGDSGSSGFLKKGCRWGDNACRGERREEAGVKPSSQDSTDENVFRT